MGKAEDKEELSLLDEMRKSRETSNVAFISFIDNYDKFTSHTFCFYEGEDGKYYNQRIKSILGNNIIPIILGNKKEVLKIWRKIKSEPIYNDISKMFFVDRDMDDIPSDKNNDLYITPCYSIENLYVDKQVFGDILESEFSLNRMDSNYKKGIDTFEKLYGQFNDLMIEFNSLLLIRNRKGLGDGKVSVNHIKTRQMISINIDKIQKGTKYDKIINDLKTKLHICQKELDNANKEIVKKGDYSNLFRGKNQLDFMVELINILKSENINGTFFDEKKRCVSINLTGNRLSELSQYAISPKCLCEFIENHKIA